MSESDASLLFIHDKQTHQQQQTHTHTQGDPSRPVYRQSQGCYTSKFDKLINIILLNHYYSSGRRYVRGVQT